MKPTINYTALMASLLLIMPLAAYADQGSKSQYQSQVLQLQMAAMTCRNTYVTGDLGDVVSVINNSTITATLTNTDISKLGTDFSSLQTDASGNNISQFKADVKVYNGDTKSANLDARTAIKTAHSKTVYSTLRTDIKQLQSTYKSCLFGVKQQYAQLKAQMFNNSLSHTQNMTSKLASHGANTTALTNVINQNSASVQAFEAAVNNAQNSTQLQAALNSFCLYNGCKDSNNSHFAANVAIQADQAKLNVLAGKNSTASYQGLVSQVQTDLTNAQTALNQVGSTQYQGNQSSTVWNNIKAASDVIQQLQQIVNHKH
jgi:hypothetical protein